MSRAVEAAMPLKPGEMNPTSTLFEALPSGSEVSVVVFDEQLIAVGASEGCVRLFGREVLSASAEELFVGFELPKGESATLDLLARREGRPRHVRAFLRRHPGSVTALLVDLEALSAGEHARSAAAARLASEVVHEVRNPLASIKMVVQTLARAQLEERLERRLVVATREVRTIERILGALSGLVRVSEPGEGSNVAKALEGAMSDTRRELEERGLRLFGEIEPVAAEGRIDVDRLRLAFAQLIGVLGHGLEAGEIRVRALSGPGGFDISVEAHPPPSWRPSGAKLYVELARKVVSEHGGRLVDCGGGFRVTLPN